MADGLFDNRYRYDFIYPRGRSGETLRAVDTANNERPVVIKRPAPNDAPPIRAGQEVSILNERKALMRLEGHPVATEYVDSGQFSAGGMTHQYIVMERAQGLIIEEAVLEAARSGERLPLLETCIIIDALLDLLVKAHEKDIVYNDVDAKHLFWDRDAYHLKVIDWGNAVFLEGDEMTPQGISRQTDIYQMGELLYFIVRGGGRADIPRDADEGFALDFGDDAEWIPDELAAIISKAAHPNTRHRYQRMRELRRDLANFRQPIERDRDATVNRVLERLRRQLSKNDLRGLLTTLEPALHADPGFPAARRANREIHERLRDLDVSADLDAVMIYMRGDNWQRAADLLNELREKAGPGTTNLVELLHDSTMLLLDTGMESAPNTIKDSLAAIHGGQFVSAAERLLTSDQEEAEARKLQWLMAERISSRIPDILLLRPNLYRLELALSAVSGGGVNLSDARNLMGEINTLLDDLSSSGETSLVRLRDGYRAVVDRLQTLNKLLSTVAVQERLPNHQLPLSSLDRALNAAMALADNMHVIGKQATSSPRDALVALDSSRSIDPVNPVWADIKAMLDSLYERLQSYQTYVPSADGSDLESWLRTSREALTPFTERLFDEMLVGMVAGLKSATECWARYGEAAVQGSRGNATAALSDAMQAVGTISPTLAAWLNQLRNVMEGSQYVQRHAIYGGLGRALADGWEAFDRGRLQEAERLGQQAKEIARNQAERDAADRLVNLAAITREWIERGGIGDTIRSEATLQQVEHLYTEEELKVRDDFAAQMPSRDTYLRAVNKGVVDVYGRISAPALRIYFMNAIILGALEAHDGNLEDGAFWREVAVRALGEYGPKQTATRALDAFLERRRDLLAAAEILNKINGKHALETLEKTRRSIEENAQARSLAPAINGLRELESTLRDWSDAEFRPAGLKLENILKAIADTEHTAGINLGQWRGWTENLNAAAADLHNRARQMRQIIERRPAEPSEVVRDSHRVMAERTTELLGGRYSAQLRQWYDTYEDFLAAYTDHSVRRSVRLERFNELFRAMFIDRHPAYPLYQHWFDVTENAPEFPAPPTDEPTPRIDEADPIEADDYTPNLDVETAPNTRYATPRRRPNRLVIALIVIVIVALAGGALLVFGGNGGDGDDNNGVAGNDSDSVSPFVATARARNTLTAEEGGEITETVDSGTAIADVSGTVETLAPDDLITPTLRTPQVQPTDTPAPTDTPEPTETPTPETPTATPEPTETPVPSDTPVPTATPTITPSLTPTVPPDGLRGAASLLDMMLRAQADELPWDADLFNGSEQDAEWRLASDDDGDPEGELQFPVPEDLMNFFYGNNAPARIRQTDATLDLVTYNAADLEAEDVVFGLLLRSLEDPSVQAGVELQVAGNGLNALNLYTREGTTRTYVRTVSVNTVTGLRISVRRDASTGDVRLFVNDEQVGNEALEFVALGDPVQPVLTVRDGGVVLTVRRWSVTLSN